MNVQPLRRFDAVNDFSPPLIVPELVLLQLRAIYELGFSSVRVTLSFNEFGPDFFGAIPYVRACRALGIDVVGVIDQFGLGFDLLRALSNPERRRRVLEAYCRVFAAPVVPASRRVRRAGGFTVQMLNEPVDSRGISAAEYVRYFLAPTRADLLSIDPSLRVISAATVGRRAGVLRLHDMLEAGLERACDAVSIHVYDADLIDDLVGLVRLPIWVTETGARGAGEQLGWYQRVLPSIRERLAGVEELFWFDLFDFEPDGFRLLEIRAAEGGGFVARVASPALFSHYTARVAEATGGVPHLPFDRLIPDLTPFLPTRDDLAIVETAR